MTRRAKSPGLFINDFPPDLREQLDALSEAAEVPVRFTVITLIRGALERMAAEGTAK